jgi:prepilin-type processing-associated H-X9-DG protein
VTIGTTGATYIGDTQMFFCPNSVYFGTGMEEMSSDTNFYYNVKFQGMIGYVYWGNPCRIWVSGSSPLTWYEPGAWGESLKLGEVGIKPNNSFAYGMSRFTRVGDKMQSPDRAVLITDNFRDNATPTINSHPQRGLASFGGGNVTYADGHVDWLEYPGWKSGGGGANYILYPYNELY